MPSETRHPLEGDVVFGEDADTAWTARHPDRPRDADRWAAIDAWRFEACQWGMTPRALARWVREVNRDETLAEKGLAHLDRRYHDDRELTPEEEDRLFDAWPWEHDDMFLECAATDAGAFPVWRIEMGAQPSHSGPTT